MQRTQFKAKLDRLTIASGALAALVTLNLLACGQGDSPPDEPWEVGERSADNISDIYYDMEGGALGNNFSLSIELREPSICVKIPLTFMYGTSNSNCANSEECIQLPSSWRLNGDGTIKNRRCGRWPNADLEYASVRHASGRIDFAAGRDGPSRIEELYLNLEVVENPPAPIPDTIIIETSNKPVVAPLPIWN